MAGYISCDERGRNTAQRSAAATELVAGIQARIHRIASSIQWYRPSLVFAWFGLVWAGIYNPLSPAPPPAAPAAVRRLCPATRRRAGTAAAAAAGGRLAHGRRDGGAARLRACAVESRFAKQNETRAPTGFRTEARTPPFPLNRASTSESLLQDSSGLLQPSGKPVTPPPCPATHHVRKARRCVDVLANQRRVPPEGVPLQRCAHQRPLPLHLSHTDELQGSGGCEPAPTGSVGLDAPGCSGRGHDEDKHRPQQPCTPSGADPRHGVSP